jgi:hypothetical protein
MRTIPGSNIAQGKIEIMRAFKRRTSLYLRIIQAQQDASVALDGREPAGPCQGQPCDRAVDRVWSRSGCVQLQVSVE